ncbi:MAG: hypothetical protein VYE40_02340 [Myxococcota bacterium]|nr:hypothetical protein [Myxococcota bacterium]
MTTRVGLVLLLLASGLAIGCFAESNEGSPAAKARGASDVVVAVEGFGEQPVLPEASRGVEFSSKTQPEPAPTPAPEKDAPEPAPPEPPGTDALLDPPHHDDVLEVCDRVIKEAMVGSFEGEGDGLIRTHAAPKELYDVPNENIAYRTRTSTKANIWRLEYDIYTGDCRHAYNYATVHFAELEDAPARSGEWRIRKNDEEYAERATLEIDGVRAVIAQDTGLEDEHGMKRAARACAEALAAAIHGEK